MARIIELFPSRLVLSGRVLSRQVMARLIKKGEEYGVHCQAEKHHPL